ncbi:hypothetical protein EA473_01115 [Natrarchaeobius chitinivorans]|uniref:Uncharacterized protein n=1 Tax=Natrarchaeobius chitinivorans TaxID=1679083 RepID=A0A3N6M307_NATCH|nr:hypothetical protein [Natrarchaeobius chitinivorans]RQG97833.1 hypothetical protein EA473_01115 [Natrarchaeobius chitinivorans]
MANRDDVSRVLAKCVTCGSVYAARQWPSGDVQPIGSDNCSCGSTDFCSIDESGTDPAANDRNKE